MRNKYGEIIYQLSKENRKIISVVVDSATDELLPLKKDIPNQIIECGISEANAIGVAAGLASCGNVPVIYGMGAFLVYRGYEFIRDDICLQNLNVKIIGSGSGVGYNNLGPTHHTTEDIAALRAFPNLKILSPASPLEVISVVKAAVNIEGPVYVRFGKAYEEELYEEVPSFQLGKANLIRQGNDITIIGTGSVISDAVQSSSHLEKQGIQVRIINMTTIKPIDEEIIIKAATETKGIITLEEHSTIGGLGSAVAEVLCKHRLNIPLELIGFQNVFCMDYGWRQDLRKMYGISADHISERVLTLLDKEV